MTEADKQSAAEARTRSTNRKLDRLIALLRRHLNKNKPLPLFRLPGGRPGQIQSAQPHDKLGALSLSKRPGRTGPRTADKPRAASTRQRGNPQPICRATGPDKYRAASQAATV